MSEESEKLIYYRPRKERNAQSMLQSKRAAQFMPFAALTGFENAVEEVGRLTENKRQLVEEEKERVSGIIRQMLSNKDGTGGEVLVIFFEPDSKKSGGKYRQIKGPIKKYNAADGTIGIRIGSEINSLATIAIKRIVEVIRVE